MKGVCDSCGMEDVEINTNKSDNGAERKLCNQCKPADGAYAY